MCPNSDEIQIDGSAGGKEILSVSDGDNRYPFHLIQEVYNKVTGKTENIVKKWNESFMFTIDDLQNLHSRLQQACTQYQIRISNNSVVVNYVDNSREEFSSMERFSMQSAASSSATESILFTFNFLIEMPQTKNVQSYKLMLRIVSDVAVRQRFLNDVPPQLAKFYYLADKPSVMLDIEYVDYTVAHNMLSLIENWLKAVPKNEYQRHIRFLQKNSHHFDVIARSVVSILICYILVAGAAELGAEKNIVRIAQYLIFSGFLLVISRHIILESSRAAEAAIDSWSPISYININKADVILFSKSESSNNKSISKLILHLALTLVNGVFVKLLVESIIKYWK